MSTRADGLLAFAVLCTLSIALCSGTWAADTDAADTPKPDAKVQPDQPADKAQPDAKPETGPETPAAKPAARDTAEDTPKAKPDEAPKDKPKDKPKPQPKPAPKLYSCDGAKPWSVPKWCDGGALNVSRKIKTEGQAGLRLVVRNPKQGKIVMSRAQVTLDLSHYDQILVDVFVEQARPYPALLTLAFQTAGKDDWIESPPRLLHPGWNRDLPFRIYTPEWKTKATDWHYVTTPLNKGKTAHVVLLFHGLDYGESVVVDNLRLALAADKAAAPLDMKLTGKPEALPAVPKSEPASADLKRADGIRVYVCETLRAYAADLRQTGRQEEAVGVAKAVTDALAAQLVAHTLPVKKPVPKPAKDKPKTDAPSKPDEPAKPTPAKPTADTPASDNALLITIPKRGEIHLDGKAMRTYFLTRKIKALGKENPTRAVIIRYAPGTALAKISSVQDACEKAGFTNITTVEGAVD